ARLRPPPCAGDPENGGLVLPPPYTPVRCNPR
ncbi:MAG: hypothetical protein QOG59_1645, partial [Solirubrobacteraceae bacterium]|nr:hypothetical protein [Solirubrobacteraceae bacterium]